MKNQQPKSLKDFKQQEIPVRQQKEVKGGKDFIGHEDLVDN
jgi:hypothetical protein